VTVTVPAETPVVTTSKVAVFIPDGTTALVCTEAPLLAESETVIPPVGAFAERVTVPVERAPLTTDAGDTATELSVWERTGLAVARQSPIRSVRSATSRDRHVRNERIGRPSGDKKTPPDRLTPPYARSPTVPSAISGSGGHFDPKMSPLLQTPPAGHPGQ
jgi:hypothetical protein